MSLSITASAPQNLVSRQSVIVKTDAGPEQIEVALAGIIASVHQAAKTDTQGALMDKTV